VGTTYRLMTVERAYRTGFGLQLEPTVKLHHVGQMQSPHEPMPYEGNEVELRLPGGEVRHAYISAFGIEAWKVGDSLVTTSDPKDPSLTLTLAGDLTVDDVPAGTEVWRLAGHSYRP
jgi:uncharacterized protein (DUF2249 family)